MEKERNGEDGKSQGEKEIEGRVRGGRRGREVAHASPNNRRLTLLANKEAQDISPTSCTTVV